MGGYPVQVPCRSVCLRGSSFGSGGSTRTGERFPGPLTLQLLTDLERSHAELRAALIQGVRGKVPLPGY